MLFRQIFDEKLAQYAYLIGCQKTGEAVVIDPERDVDRYIDLAKATSELAVMAADCEAAANLGAGTRRHAAAAGAAATAEEVLDGMANRNASCK